MSSIIVDNIVFEDLTPKVDKPSLARLIPTTVVPYAMSFEIKNGNAQLANAIRRTLSMELEASIMEFDFKDFKCTDKFVLVDMIRNRFRLIPILQNTPLDVTFRLEVTNTTEDIINVTAADIKGAKRLPANQQFIICTLQPGTHIKIENIKISRGYGYMFAGYALACNVVSLALDVVPPNAYTGEKGVPSSLANPKHHKIAFNSNGGMAGNDMILACCKNLIARFKAVLELLPDVTHTGKTFALVIRGETDTVAALLTRTIYELNKDIPLVNYYNDAVIRLTTIRMITSDNNIDTVKKMIQDAVAQIITQLGAISKFF
jgi:DNA-directed RNA polymerase alpha subunit